MPTTATVWPAAIRCGGRCSWRSRAARPGKAGRRARRGAAPRPRPRRRRIRRRPCRERRDAVAPRQPRDPVADGVHHAPALVPERARLGRETSSTPARPTASGWRRRPHTPARARAPGRPPARGAGPRPTAPAPARPGPRPAHRPRRHGCSAHDAMPPTLRMLRHASSNAPQDDAHSCAPAPTYS